MADILFLAHRIPFPPNKGDKLRSFHVLKYLSEQFRVHLGTFVDDEEDWRHVEPLKRYCAESYFASLNPLTARIRSLPALLSAEALTVHYYKDQGLAQWVDSIVARHDIAHIITFSSPMAQYAVKHVKASRLADMVDVDSAKWEQYAADKAWPLSWLYRREGRTLLKFEKKIAQLFDATVFVSSAEADLFIRSSGVATDRIHYAGNGVDTDYFSPDAKFPNPYSGADRVLVFTGAMDYLPNADAAQWFAHEVFGEIRNRWPDALFGIVGARPSSAVRRLGKLPGVIVTGSVPDIRPYIAHATAVVAPLRIARGVQNKVLEGMAMGRTVIASSGAARGLDVRPGFDILVADVREDYVDLVNTIFAGSHTLGSNARATALRSYSWERNVHRMISLLDRQHCRYEPSDRQLSAVAQS